MLWDNKREYPLPVICQSCKQQVLIQFKNIGMDDVLTGVCPNCQTENDIQAVEYQGLPDATISVNMDWIIKGKFHTHKASFSHEGISDKIDALSMMLSESCFILADEDSPIVLMDRLIKNHIETMYTTEGLAELEKFIVETRLKMEAD